MVRRVLRWTDSVLIGVATVCFAGFLACVALQVVFRYVLQQPLVWSEELALYLFIWSSLLAAAVLVGSREHFSISYFAGLLPAGVRRGLDFATLVLCMGFALLVAVKGAEWSWRMRSALSTILQIPQGLPYLILPVAASYMLLHFVDQFLRMLRGEHPEDSRPC